VAAVPVEEQMAEYRVIIPEEAFSVIEFRQNNLPGIGVINSSLVAFEPKAVFAWHLSIMIQFKGLIENGMPSQAERDVVDPFGDEIVRRIKGSDPTKPNALLLGRITWNATREILFRVYDPEEANKYLTTLVEGNCCRPLDYRMEADEEWKLAKWHLDAAKQ
jgi:hypothetical protein